MPFLELLAQQAADAGASPPWWDAPETRILGRQWESPPYLAIPIFLGVLAVVSLLVERISVHLLRRITARTETRVDDAFVAGLPRVVRTACVLIALNCVTHALLPEDSRDVAGKIVLAISIVVFGIVITGFALRLVDAWGESRPAVKALAPGVRLTVKVAAIPLLLITVLRVFGVPIEAFLTALGIGSLAVALALQDVLKNIFSGIQIVMDQPVRAGDFVLLSNGVRGTVLEIGLRSTRLRTVDNHIVILPNSTLANEIVTNVDVIDKTYMHHVTLGVDYGSDTRKVEAALRDEAANAIAAIPGAFVDESPKVVFLAFGASSLDFRVSVRLRQYAGQFEPLSELNHRLLARLRAEGVSIPFPTRTVYLRNEPS